MLDTGLENIGHAGLVSDLTPETVLPGCDGARRGCSHSCAARFVGIDLHVGSVCVRTGRHHIRNTLFDTVPRIEELSGDVVAGSELQAIYLALRYGVRNEVRETGNFGGVGCETGVVIRALALGEGRVRVVVHGHGAREEIHQRVVGRRKGRHGDTVGVRIGLVGGKLFLHLREGVSQHGFLLAGDHQVGGHLPQAHLAVIDQLPIVRRGGFVVPFVGIGDVEGRGERTSRSRGAEPHVVHLIGYGRGGRAVEYPGFGPGQPKGFAGFGDSRGAAAVRNTVPLIDAVLEDEFVAFVGHFTVGGNLAVVAVVDMSLALGVRGPLAGGVVVERGDLLAAPGDDRLVDLVLQVGEDRLIDVVHDPL